VWPHNTTKYSNANLSNFQSFYKTAEVVKHKEQTKKKIKDGSIVDNDMFTVILKEKCESLLKAQSPLEHLPKIVWVGEVAVGDSRCQKLRET